MPDQPSKQRRRGAITADELMHQLQANPAYQERRREQRELQRRNAAEFRRAAASVYTELQALGIDTDVIGSFPTTVDYRAAIPVLMKWLPRMTDERVREGIVRALSVPWARPVAAPLLIAEFQKDPAPSNLKWVIGNGLEVVADDSVFADLVSLVADKRHGYSRAMIVMALGKTKAHRDEAIHVCANLLDDDDVAGHAIIALRRLGATRVRKQVARFLDHPTKWWRDEAKKSIAKFDRLDAGKKR